MDYKDYNFGNLQYPCSYTKIVQGTEMKALCSLVFHQSLRNIYCMMGNYQASPGHKLWFSTGKKINNKWNDMCEEKNTEKNSEFQMGIEPTTFSTQNITRVKAENRSKWMLEEKSSNQ